MGVMPAIVFWQAARYFETSLFITWGQRSLASQFADHKLALKDPSDTKLMKLGDYSKFFYDTCIDPRDGNSRRQCPQGKGASMGDCLLSNLTIPFNQTAAEIRTFIGECQRPSGEETSQQAQGSVVAWNWDRTPNRPFTVTQPDLKIETSEFPSFRRPQSGSDWVALIAMLVIFGLLPAGLFSLIRYSVSRVFLLEPEIADQDTQHVLALGPVGSFKKEWLNRKFTTDWLNRKKVAKPIEISTMTDWNKALGDAPEDVPIAIDHLEYRLDDKELTEEKLKLLEQVVFAGKHPVLIVSSVDPRYYLARSDSVDQGQLTRWVAVLSRFSEQHFPLEAGKHYDATWALCTDEEKLMLVQVAQGALVNPNGQAALRQLWWKGLVKGPSYRIKDPEFRKFVCSVQRPSDVRRWEREGGDGWRTMQTGVVTLLAGMALILFVAQRDLLQSSIPYIMGLAGWLASVSKVFEGVRGFKSTKSE